MKLHRAITAIISMRLILGERLGVFLTPIYIVRSRKLHATASAIPKGMRTEFGSCHQICLSISSTMEEL